MKYMDMKNTFNSGRNSTFVSTTNKSAKPLNFKSVNSYTKSNAPSPNNSELRNRLNQSSMNKMPATRNSVSP